MLIFLCFLFKLVLNFFMFYKFLLVIFLVIFKCFGNFLFWESLNKIRKKGKKNFLFFIKDFVFGNYIDKIKVLGK